MDGTATKSRLGANAIIGVSLAATRAQALATGQELWRYLAEAAGIRPLLPVPHFNVVNGGAHAVNDLDFQEFMRAPIGAPSRPEAVRAGAEVYAPARGERVAKYNRLIEIATAEPSLPYGLSR